MSTLAMTRTKSSLHVPIVFSLVRKGEEGSPSPSLAHSSTPPPTLPSHQQSEISRAQALTHLMERMSLSRLSPHVKDLSEEVAVTREAAVEHELSSEEGKAIFKSALAAGSMQSYFALAQQLVTQIDPKVRTIYRWKQRMSALAQFDHLTISGTYFPHITSWNCFTDCILRTCRWLLSVR